MKNTTAKIPERSRSFKVSFQTTGQKTVMAKWVMMSLLIFCVIKTQAQTDIISPVDFNIEIDQPLKNPGGLTVGMTLASWEEQTTKLAVLDGSPERELVKGVFELDITVQNNGANDIAIYDWSFKAICPKNVHGQEWQADSKAPKLVTAYIPSSIFIVLKPGEKKILRSAPSDFYWCLSPDPKSLLVKPKFLTAKIVCGIINSQKKLASYKPNMQQLIQDYWKLVAEGKTTEAKAKRQQIIDLSAIDYPTKKQELLSLLGEPSTGAYAKKKAGTIPNPAPSSNKAGASATTNNSVYSDWLTVKNPYYSMQVRYKLEKKEGDVGYYKTQLRIDYDDKSRCVDPRCLGYVVCFGYPTTDEKDFIYLHYKFYYPYKEIYTMPDLIPIKVSFADGSKRILKQDGFYYTAKGNPTETYIPYFDKSVDLILDGSPVKCKNYIDSKAVILK